MLESYYSSSGMKALKTNCSTFHATIALLCHVEAVITQMSHVAHYFPTLSLPLEMMMANLFC